MYRRERGCLEGAVGAVCEEEKRKGVVRQALQTLCSGGTSEKPSHISRLKKNKGFAAAEVNKEPRRSFRAQTPQDVLDRSHA